jgi:hypothetical protein
MLTIRIKIRAAALVIVNHWLRTGGREKKRSISIREWVERR